MPGPPKILDSGGTGFYIMRLSNFAPMRLTHILACAAALQCLPVSAAGQGGDAGARPERDPPREVRAVWLTTAAALDWPPQADPEAQRASLARIVDSLDRSGFNTIFFQARGRGDALYRPGLEPWSDVLTGAAGRDPGWDPLEFILGEAHRRGMEVHAWMNVYFVRGAPGRPPRTVPPHVIDAHPGWARFHDDRWWLDPGEPAVSDFLVAVVEDLARRYDVDGIHLDYIRYPGRNFDDRESYARHGRGIPRDDWRRANVTGFLERVRASLRGIRPLLKLGAAPIGIYRNPPGIRGLESYADVYQDTRRWIALGLLDYVVPQLYWPIGGGKGDPDFAAMAEEWRAVATGCQLYLGIGSYKEEVRAQTDLLVAAARGSGADGQAFFRWSSIAPQLPLLPYRARVLPPPMPWKDAVPPPPPGAVTVTDLPGARRVEWEPGAGSGEQGERYAVYRMTLGPGGETVAESLMAVVPAEVRSVIDSSARGPAGQGYAVTRIDRTWNESPPVTPVRTFASGAARDTLREGAQAAPPATEGREDAAPAGILRLGTPWAERATGTLFVPLRLGAGAGVAVELVAEGGGPARRSRAAAGRAGHQVLTLDIRGLPPGAYLCRVTAGADSCERTVPVGR